MLYFPPDDLLLNRPLTRALPYITARGTHTVSPFREADDCNQPLTHPLKTSDVWGRFVVL